MSLLDTPRKSQRILDIPGEQQEAQELPILPLERDDLNEQCRVCLENIRTCVKAAWGKYTYTLRFTRLSIARELFNKVNNANSMVNSSCI